MLHTSLWSRSQISLSKARPSMGDEREAINEHGAIAGPSRSHSLSDGGDHGSKRRLGLSRWLPSSSFRQATSPNATEEEEAQKPIAPGQHQRKQSKSFFPTLSVSSRKVQPPQQSFTVVRSPAAHRGGGARSAEPATSSTQPGDASTPAILSAQSQRSQSRDAASPSYPPNVARTRGALSALNRRMSGLSAQSGQAPSPPLKPSKSESTGSFTLKSMRNVRDDPSSVYTGMTDRSYFSSTPGLAGPTPTTSPSDQRITPPLASSNGEVTTSEVVTSPTSPALSPTIPATSASRIYNSADPNSMGSSISVAKFRAARARTESGSWTPIEGGAQSPGLGPTSMLHGNSMTPSEQLAALEASLAAKGGRATPLLSRTRGNSFSDEYLLDSALANNSAPEQAPAVPGKDDIERRRLISRMSLQPAPILDKLLVGDDKISAHEAEWAKRRLSASPNLLDKRSSALDMPSTNEVPPSSQSADLQSSLKLQNVLHQRSLSNTQSDDTQRSPALATEDVLPQPPQAFSEALPSERVLVASPSWLPAGSTVEAGMMAQAARAGVRPLNRTAVSDSEKSDPGAGLDTAAADGPSALATTPEPLEPQASQGRSHAGYFDIPSAAVNGGASDRKTDDAVGTPLSPPFHSKLVVVNASPSLDTSHDSPSSTATAKRQSLPWKRASLPAEEALGTGRRHPLGETFTVQSEQDNDTRNAPSVSPIPSTDSTVEQNFRSPAICQGSTSKPADLLNFHARQAQALSTASGAPSSLVASDVMNETISPPCIDPAHWEHLSPEHRAWLHGQHLQAVVAARAAYQQAYDQAMEHALATLPAFTRTKGSASPQRSRQGSRAQLRSPSVSATSSRRDANGEPRVGKANGLARSPSAKFMMTPFVDTNIPLPAIDAPGPSLGDAASSTLTDKLKRRVQDRGFEPGTYSSTKRDLD
ncbi:unnamed protein product [Jaminaea pallidilutea]